MGRLRHLPLNATSRIISSAAPPASSTWSAAIQAAGIVGIPTNAKGVRVKVNYNIYLTAAGIGYSQVGFSDDTSNEPNITYASPTIGEIANGNEGTIGSIRFYEIDIPLNSSGQFYIYTAAILANVTLASSHLNIVAVGYYMGETEALAKDSCSCRAANVSRIILPRQK